ncbi:serine hydrolase domain-containing protein [Dactylosporangium vinaceum]|uniref:Serine hydrolase domain-containing protein n=1 Tax=Dactylosporangium vinaceum TaxID=53362 RepID=A0ABV5MGG3_9ACTN|nr:serine hydrolase domain-containing protein [Dactylosporangium vinaceum]
MTAMPRRALLAAAALGGAALAAGRPGFAFAADPPWYAPMEQAISGLPDGSATAAQVRLARPGQSWEGRCGYADITTQAPVPAGARFRIGSVTKAFTATVVLQLAAEGRLHLDAPLSRYLPGFLTAPYAAVTVRHLLDHRTGLPAPGQPDDIEWQIAHRFDRYSPEQLVRMALAGEREFAPGSAQHYTNMGYIVAGVLIRRITGHSYADEIDRRILRPLGLRATSVPGNDPAIHGPHAHGYQAVGTELVDVTLWNQSVTPAAGDMISSLGDLDVFMQALYRGRLLPPAQQRELFTLPPADVLDFQTGARATYSAGLTRLVILPDGREIWGKSGARYGYSAAIAGTADAASRVLYSVNSTDAKAEGQAAVISRITLTALSLL